MAKHVDELLTAYVHQELHGTELEEVERHLKECRECRQELARIKDVTDLLCSAKVLRSRDVFLEVQEHRRSPIFLRLALVGAIAGVVAASWLSYTPANVMRTGPSESKQISIADLGEVELKPNSEAVMVASGPTQHRMRLVRGELSAHVTAPPRLFVIETPSAEAVDLGCAYTLNVDDEGNTLLKVTSGWVALEREGPDSMVPAGWSCRTIKGRGIGTPMCGNAQPEFCRVLNRFDVSGDEACLTPILKSARPEDSLSLWHLLARTTRLRPAVYAALHARVPLPSRVKRADVLSLDAHALEAWRQEIVYANTPDLILLPFGLGIIHKSRDLLKS